MARVKITEYRAKRLILGDSYRGVSLDSGRSAPLPEGRYVFKVDQGVKKRMKQGLVALDASASEIPGILASYEKRGFSRFLAEPYLPHEPEEERYLSLERVRGGVRLLSASEGGIDVEESPESVLSFLIASPKDVEGIARETGIPPVFLQGLVQAFEKNFFAFLEINPLVVRGEEVYLLDAAVMVDSAASFFVSSRWSEADIVESKTAHPTEAAVRRLQKTTPASLKLTVLHPDGSLFFLLSGGGGSIVIADQAALRGAGDRIGNYGEYSGGPTREETHLYTREVLKLLLASPKKKKALVIAGGVANFTDVKATFAGIIDALAESADKLRKGNVNVFVRRGGPHEREGLARMEAFLREERLLGTVHGSDAPITAAVDEAIDYVGL